jgi:APA family basic amino acid/polyamine antiporter
LSLVIGTGVVSLLYILANVVYVYVLSVPQIQSAESDRVGTLLMQTLLGDGGRYFMAIMIMISTFGCINGMVLSGGRVYYAMAQDKLFFPQAAVLNRNKVPANALAFQGIWACMLTLSGSYGQLLDYVIFSVMVFYILTVAGVFVLRRTRPDAPRPYRAVGYPWLPALYIIAALVICISLLTDKGTQKGAFWGLLIVLLGIPIYYVLHSRLQANPVEKR